MRKIKSTVAILLIAALMTMPIVVTANTQDDSIVRIVGGEAFVSLVHVADAIDATLEWDWVNNIALVILPDGNHSLFEIEAMGGFVENNLPWLPAEMLVNLLMADYLEQRVERLDLTLWEASRFADVRETSFSTDLPHGVIAVNYIEYMSNNLYARSPFTYRELEAAVWIVEELLAMGHDFSNITVQEFTYWDARDLDLGLSPLSWNRVMSPALLGEGRFYQLRPDRVSQNIILTLPGQSERKIIVGAHYDSPPYPSASDNASGTALLLESAQRMLELEHYYTIVYIFFGAEEVGLIGAFYYVESLTESQHDNIVMMVNADVLIEGPYIIYGAGQAPVMDDALITYLQEAVLEALMDILVEQFDDFMESIAVYIEELQIDPASIMTFEYFVEYVRNDINSFSAERLLVHAAMLNVVTPEINAVASQVSQIAAEVVAAHNLDVISIPEAAMFSSDNLAFFVANHTVVNLTGLERRGNIDEELAEQLTRYGEGFGDFTVTILHTPLDEFNTIESIWPGMMQANMEAFGLLLEGILTGRFNS